MKGFYTFAAAIAAGSMVASAFNPQLPAAVENDAPVLHQAPVYTQLGTNQKFTSSMTSRADEVEIDITQFNTLVYIDYFAFFENGQMTPDMVFSSNSISITPNAEGFECARLFGLSEEIFKNVQFEITPEGRLAAECGQVLVSDAQYNYILGAIGDDGTKFEGYTYFKVYTNALEAEDWLGVVVVNKATGEVDGWYCCAVDPIIFPANATIEYDVKQTRNDGEVNEFHVANRIFVQYIADGFQDETDWGQITADVFALSNVAYMNDGYMIDFIVSDGYAVTYQNRPYAFPSEYLGNGQYTGIFNLVSMYRDENDELVVMYGTEGLVNEEMTTFTYPQASESSMIQEFEGWCIWQEDGYWLGQNSQAVVTFDAPLYLLDGVEDAVIAESELDGPVEYYNLQGMKVNVPQAGKVYIVKQGSKVSKQVIR